MTSHNREKPVSPAADIPRRRFLATSLAGLGGLALTGRSTLADSAPKPDGRYIDAHVHVWTPETQRYPLAPGWARDRMQPPSFTPEQLLEDARPEGVGRVVLIQMSFYGWDNSYMLDTIKAYKGVFSGVAVIDTEQEDPGREMRRLAGRGVRGFRIYPKNLPPQRWLDGVGMAKMWRTGAEEGLAMCCLVNPRDLPAINRMCRKHPDTPVVIDHFARVGITGEIVKSELDTLCDLAKHPNVKMKVSAFYALGQKKAPYLDLAPMIRRVLDAYGPERLMWATDCPYQVVDGHNYADSIALVRDRLDFLSDSDRDWLLTGTAEKTFFD